MTSPDFWTLLKTLAAKEDQSQAAFTVLERGIGGTPPAILAENYEAAISLLGDFASASRSTALPKIKSSVAKMGGISTSTPAGE